MMSPYEPKGGKRRTKRQPKVNPGEPSMSAPQPMPGKPAATYVKPPKVQEAPAQQGHVQQQSQTASGWSNPYSAQQPYSQYPQQSYPQRSPSQGIPAGPYPQQSASWQQGYTPHPQQSAHQPTGRGWTQPYPVQQAQQQGQAPQGWQGGYAAHPWAGNGQVPNVDNPLAQEPAQNKKTGAQYANSIKLIAAVIAIVAAIVLVSGSMRKQDQSAAIRAEVDSYSNRFCQGVYVDGIHLGGMTQEEAYETVQKNAQLRCDEWNVQLMTGNGTYLGEINSYHLGMTVHVEDALNDAWRQGHTARTYNERKAEMDALLVEPYIGTTALPSGNTGEIDNILNALAESAYVPAQDAYEVFDPTVNLGTPFTIVPEVVGQYLDVSSVKAQVYDMVGRMESGMITIEPTPIYPAVTAAQIVQRTTLIGSAYTKISTTSSDNRDANIARAAELINGTIIEPGKTFSFNKVVGARSKGNGFHLATVYAYGKEEEGYGGGVCQVSSTMYWAAIRANLEIVKREQHALKVGYTELGFDATVNYDGRKIDFSFRNNTSSPIYILTKVILNPRVDKQRYLVTCDIYGAALEPGLAYDIVAVQSVIEPTEKFIPDQAAEYVVYSDETYSIPGTPGTQVDSYKVKYIDSVEVERTHLYTDIYKATETMTYVGVTERPQATEEVWE